MNGILSFLAICAVGAGIATGGYFIADSLRENGSDNGGITRAELEQFKADYMKEAELKFEGSCACCEELEAMRAMCPAPDGRLGALEAPYSAGVAVTDLDGGATDRLGLSDESDLGQTATAPSEADNNSMTTERLVTESETVRLASVDTGASTETEVRRSTGRIDKPDTNRFFTEDQHMPGNTTRSTGRVDKPDSEEYYTETTRMPSDETYTAENTYSEDTRTGSVTINERQFGDPCLFDDGTTYTGPGTVYDPFADESPCLVPDPEPELVDVPYQVAEVPNNVWTPSDNSWSPSDEDFPRSTLVPNGSDYPIQ